ncbi:hypothetical protein B0I22_1639 [Epilithonimonas xixisoli]|uniref:Uncharacterized protein n=1 Tax=Epilithonimonas xixisoli TaxID=1476462 RepID=A0A4R8I6N7_9FLAO|nr:hypothetical protein B0I22_1639 [Epilithonimonas xixisoli]
MKKIHTQTTTTHYALYSNCIEERTKHICFWGLLAFTTRRIYNNKILV